MMARSVVAWLTLDQVVSCCFRACDCSLRLWLGPSSLPHQCVHAKLDRSTCCLLGGCHCSSMNHLPWGFLCAFAWLHRLPVHGAGQRWSQCRTLHYYWRRVSRWKRNPVERRSVRKLFSRMSATADSNERRESNIGIWCMSMIWGRNPLHSDTVPEGDSGEAVETCIPILVPLLLSASDPSLWKAMYERGWSIV